MKKEHLTRFVPPLMLVLTVVLCLMALPARTSGLSGFRSAFAGRAVPTSPEGPQIVQSVCLIVIDGLRYDAVERNMPFLAGLRRNGAAWGKLLVGMPSYSRPAYARLLSGAPSELTGVTMNDQTEPLHVPTIFSLAKMIGKRTAAAAHYWWRELSEELSAAEKEGRLSGRMIDHGYYYAESDPDARVFAAAKDLLRERDPDLLVVLPMSADDIGHEKGGSSEAYRENAAAIDACLADFCRSLADTERLIIITADHGHRNAGGHGGGEADVREVPLFILGPRVREGRLPAPVDQLDVAPTVAAALGLPMSGVMGGRVIGEAFSDPNEWHPAQENLLSVQRAFMAANVDLLGEGAKEPSAEFSTVWRRARARFLTKNALWRLPVALAMLLGIMAVVLIGLRKRRIWLAPFAAGLAYPLYFYACFRLLGYDYSYSAVISAFDLVIKTVLAAVAALAVLTWAGAALRRGREPYLRPIALGIWAGQGLLTAAAWTVVGGKCARFLPPIDWELLLGVQLLVTTIAAVYATVLWVTTIPRKQTGSVPSQD